MSDAGMSDGGMKAWAIRNLLWPLMDAFKGNRVRQYLEEMERHQYQSIDQIEALQKEKLQTLLLHCVQTVPAYQRFQAELQQEMEGTSWDPKKFLRKLPVLTKTEFNERREDYLSTAADQAKLIPNRTGGSTGEPTRFYIDRFTVEHYEAARWRGLGWNGIRIGDSSVMIWGSAIELNQLQTRQFIWKERFLKNRIFISAYDLKEARLEQYLKRLQRFKPKYLYGYASALSLFAEMILHAGHKVDLPLQAVISTSETLHPHQREAIGQAFGCSVVNEYGARDGGIIAFECAHGRMHIPAENSQLEVVDLITKRPLPTGQKGLLLVTDLNNFSMPRLRYELGDIAALSEQLCTCGIRLPILEHIEGRETDVFISSAGDYVYGAYFNRLMLHLNSFRGFQMIQHAPDQMTVKFIKHPESYSPDEEQGFVDSIHKALGDNIKINIEYVAEIPRTASGKLRYAVREFDLH